MQTWTCRTFPYVFWGHFGDIWGHSRTRLRIQELNWYSLTDKNDFSTSNTGASIVSSPFWYGQRHNLCWLGCLYPAVTSSARAACSDVPTRFTGQSTWADLCSSCSIPLLWQHVSQDWGSCAGRAQQIMKYCLDFSSNSVSSRISLVPKGFLPCAKHEFVLSCFEILCGIFLLQMKVNKPFNWKAKILRLWQREGRSHTHQNHTVLQMCVP